MYRSKRRDTLVRTIERQYGIDLNARSDARLGNLLDRRGFDSLTQLVKAHRGEPFRPARKRRLFLSFHAEDKEHVDGFRALALDPDVDIDFYDGSLREPIQSERAATIKRKLQAKINKASVVVCLVGNGTGWRDWVDWELHYAYQRRKGICSVRLPNTFGRSPQLLKQIGAPSALWDVRSIVIAIEAAAARRT